MRTFIIGDLVDLESKPWNFNGKSGTAYAAFVRLGGERDGAQRVKVTPEQYVQCAKGERVVWPVGAYAQSSDYGAPRLQVVLESGYMPSTGVPAELAELADQLSASGKH